MSKRQCKGTNKAGEPCRAAPLVDGDYCLAHDEEARALTGFGGSENGSLGGRPRKPHAVTILRERVEAEIDLWLAPYREAVANAVVVVEYHGEAIVTDIADLGARIMAAEKVLDRVYGRPTQSTEISGPGGGPISIADVWTTAVVADVAASLN